MANNLLDIKELEKFSILYTKSGMEAYSKAQYKDALIHWLEARKNLILLQSKIADTKTNASSALDETSNVLNDINEKIVHLLTKFGDEEYKKNNYIAAIVLYEESLKVKPKDADTYNMLGYMYKLVNGKYKNIDKQIEYFEKAIELNPEHIQATRSLALTYPLIGKTSEAIECFNKLFKLGAVKDDYVAYGQLKIQTGEIKEGWEYYEKRFEIDNASTFYPKIEGPRWSGQPILDKILLVHYEQGYGDSFQFFRYLEQVKPLVKKLIFRAQNNLADLLKFNANGFEIVDMNTPLEKIEYDYHVPLMSIPCFTDISRDNIPLTQGYIKAELDKIEYYKKDFFNNDCLKIGISWSGAKFGNSYRDVPLNVFYPLTKLKNVKIYSFQKNFGAEQLDDLPTDIEIVDLGKTFNDFSDTAAAISNLDLFITSDNGVFNLAAAMGTRTFLLLNKFSEWRWFFDEEKTPWYDSVTIFKKKNEDDGWSSLMDRVIETISK